MNNKKTKSKTKKNIVIGTIGIASLFIAAPSYAFSLNINDFFNGILGGVNSYFQQIQTNASNTINQKWAGLKQDAQNAVNESLGIMQAPNPIAAGENIRGIIAENGVSQKDNNIIQGAVFEQNALEQGITRASVESVLGNEGQQRTRNEINATAQTVSDAQALADGAQQMDASQDILKVIAAQNAQVVSIIAQSRTDGLQARQDAQQTNLMLSQIAKQGDSKRLRENLQIDGLTAQHMEIAGYTTLTTTAGCTITAVPGTSGGTTMTSCPP
ncbi:hypothetical protein NIES4071_102350 (plasmid) [Calothrix sp. NIES-4071]|nr:hypothetical protein NIES4071_102350 [Calothrix sp. NIES-4071]BAZ64616.1 hypothetical protein NIES4105_103490 [Calothrix sp. NIES-4105]